MRVWIRIWTWQLNNGIILYMCVARRDYMHVKPCTNMSMNEYEWKHDDNDGDDDDDEHNVETNVQHILGCI